MRKFSKSIFILSDQVLFSIGNFGLTIVLSRLYGSEIFAGFGIGLSVALMIQSIQRGIYVVPNALQSTRRAKKLITGILAEHNIVLAIMAAIFVCLILLVEVLSKFSLAEDLTKSLVIASFACSLIYMQADFDRVVYSRGKLVYIPCFFSLVYVLLILSLYHYSNYYRLSYVFFLSLIIALFVIKSLVAVFFVARPNFKWGLVLFKRDFSIRGRFSFEGALAYAGYNHIPLFVLGFTASPIEAAAFVAMRGLVQPVQIIIRALDVSDKLELVDLWKSGKDIRLIFWRTIAKYFFVCFLMIVGTVIFSPIIAGVAYKNAYLGYEWLMVGHTIVFLLLSLTLPVESLININNLYSQTRFWRLASFSLGIGLSIALCSHIGALGAMVATLIGWLVAFFGGCVVVRKLIFVIK